MSRGILTILTSAMILIVCVQIGAARVYYVLPNGEPKVEEVEIPSEENPFSFIFDRLSNPPRGCLRLLPKDAFRAVYVVRDMLYLDVYGDKFSGYTFDEVRYLIHSLMSTIFNTFEGINWVKLLVDGHDDRPLAGVIETSYAFPKEVWRNWPITRSP